MSETRQMIIFFCVVTAMLVSFWNLTETIRLHAAFDASRSSIAEEGK